MTVQNRARFRLTLQDVADRVLDRDHQAAVCSSSIARGNREIPPGRYSMRAVYDLRQGSSESNSVAIEMKALSPEDSAIVARLRTRNVSGDASWARFVDAPEGSIDASPLGDHLRSALALHLFLRDVADRHVQAVDLVPSSPSVFAAGPVAGEAALYRFEILLARGEHDAADSLAAEIGAKWPDLRYRLAEIRGGRGLLARLGRKR